MRCVTAVLAALVFVSCVSASPDIERASTFALKSKGETEITIFGSSLRETAALWLSVPADVKLIGEPRDNHVKFRIRLNTNVVQRVCWARVVASNGISNVRGFVVDDVAAETASQTNRTRATAQKLTTPIAVDGTAEELNASWFRIAANKRERVSIEIVATRLGSRLDSVLRVVDTRGRELASNDDAPGIRGDSLLTFEAPEAGDYFVELRDVNYAGGRDYFYRLRVGAEPLARSFPVAQQTEREPNDSANSATSFNLSRDITGQFSSAKDVDVFRFVAKAKQETTFRARTRSIGAGCDVMLRIENANGELLAKSNVSAADEGVVTHTFAADGEFRLLVREAVGVFGAAAFYVIEASEPAGFALSVDTDRVEAPVDGSFKLKVNCVRAGYKGPVVLMIPDVAGLAVTNHIILQGATNVTLTAALLATMSPASAHAFRVQGRAQSRKNAPSVTASTAPAWGKAFPQMRYAPAELEPFITLGVTAK